MTLVQLSYIVAVDNYKSFGEAAKRLFVTQPTLSMQINKLEEELGAKIFDRCRQPVKATAIGSKIINQARIVLAEAGKVKDIINFETSELKGKLRLGVIPTIAPYLIPGFLESFTSKYPEIDLVIDEIQTGVIIEKLRKDELDAAILATPVAADGITEEPVFYEPFYAYISEGHRLFGKKEIAPGDLNLDDLWLLKEGHCFRDQVLNICRAYREEITTGRGSLNFEGGTLETLIRLVENNFGMTLVPYLMARELGETPKQKLLRPFTHPAPSREISIIYRKTYLRQQLIKIVKEEIYASVPAELQQPGGKVLRQKLYEESKW